MFGIPGFVGVIWVMMLFVMSFLIALEQVFLLPTPIACSAAIGRVNWLHFILGSVFLLELCLLSFICGSKDICVSAKMRVVCAAGFSLAKVSEYTRPLGATLNLINLIES